MTCRTNKHKREQKKLTLGNHNAQFLSLVKTSDGTFRMRFLVLDEKLKDTESVATLNKFNAFQINKLFNGKTEAEMMHTQWEVRIAKNSYNDLLTITEAKQKKFNFPRWFVELQENWQGCKNGEAPSETKRAYLEEREKKDPKFKRTNEAREILNRGIRGQLPTHLYLKVFGCNYKQLINFIERQFRKGMTWNNRGTVWHLDHVKPLAGFNLLDINELKEAMHFSNLQPLAIEENLLKYCNAPTLSTLEILFNE